MPLVNPVGMYKGYRSNGNGVDLMRNSPIESKEKVYPFVGGHRIILNTFLGIGGNLKRLRKRVTNIVIL